MLSVLGVLVGCEYDDSVIFDRLNTLEEEWEQMQAEQLQMQQQIATQQLLLDALGKRLTITSIAENENGYSITFSDGTSATIKDGKDGANGKDGKDGADGKDGVDGTNGKDGIDGKDGADGKDGDTLFASVEIGEDSVKFTLADRSVIVIPLCDCGCDDPSTEYNKIYYTTTDGEKLDINEQFGSATLLSHEFVDGQYVLTFDQEVTTIGKWTFSQCSSLASVTLPESITTIGGGAFSDCTSLDSIIIPKGVTSIGYSAFERCSALKSIIIPEGVTKIDVETFWNCSSLESITLPDGITTIDLQAFYGCSSLQNIIIPESVTEIENDAFTKCTSLRSIIIPKNVTTFGWGMVRDCTSLESITLPEGITMVGYSFDKNWLPSLKIFVSKLASSDGRCLIVDGKLMTFAPAGLTEYAIPEGVTTIGDSAFSGCTSLESITIPEGVTTIENSAFFGCTSLKSVVIPEGVTTIGNSAFFGCTSLKSVVIPDGVTTIGLGAFQLCTSLKSIKIPDSVTTIERITFQDCISLEKFEGKSASSDGRCWIMDGVLKFFAYGGLTEYTIPEGVTTIGAQAFYGAVYQGNNTSLESLTLPESVTKLEPLAIFDKKIKNIYCMATEPPTMDGAAFNLSNVEMRIYVPAASVEAYKTAEDWSRYAQRIVGYDF